MPPAKYSIGIDLGTTNCAVSFVSLSEKDGVTRVLDIPQWENASTLGSAPTLPSFLYRPPAGEAGQVLGKSGGGDWIVGRWARAQAGKTPGRVAHSAKSWLCSHGSDRRKSFLPWGSQELPEPEKISPIRASALLLGYLRGVWNDAWGGEAPFHHQLVTVTVPASFDAAAQKLTLDAAKDAGFPDGVRLLEEPQAAFYRWLEVHESRNTLQDQLTGLRARPHHVLVVDVGGGTTDFSLFEIRLAAGRKLPEIRRVAVSDHILLGGDNMDLALAHWIEPRLGVESLSADQWSHLVAQCRAVKEEALQRKAESGKQKAGSGEKSASFSFPDVSSQLSERQFRITVPSRGAGLLKGTLSAEIDAGELLSFLLGGFYPECAADVVPERAAGALREWGLPYAADTGITRHLAEFLRGLPEVDAVLFNGGSLEPAAVRERLVNQLTRWQPGRDLVVLDNEERHLAVARGAARYGLLLRRNEARIQAGAARSLYLETHAGEGEEERLVCILPKGTPAGEEVLVEGMGLQVRVNQPVTFRLFSSAKGDRDEPGQVVSFREGKHLPMPALQTVIPAGKKGETQVPVRLSSRLNALGLLQVDCVGPGKRWPLEFQLREGDEGGAAPARSVVVAPGVEDAVLETARARIGALFRSPWNKRDPLTPARLVSSLERLLGLPKADWNAALLRALWPALRARFHDREHSFEHEESWASLAGLLLRPGFGVELDEQRIDQLWEFHKDGFWYPGKAMQLNADVLWRRVAGGLSPEREAILAEDALQRVRQAEKKPPAEAVRLLGALERLDLERKREIAHLLLERAGARLQEGGYAEPFLAALSRLLNRALLHAGPESVLPPALVAEAYDRLAPFDWDKAGGGELITLFLRAARVVDDRALDLEPGLRRQIAAKLRQAGVAPARLVPLEKFVALQESDRVSLFGESLPAGLVLAADETKKSLRR